MFFVLSLVCFTRGSETEIETVTGFETEPETETETKTDTAIETKTKIETEPLRQDLLRAR